MKRILPSKERFIYAVFISFLFVSCGLNEYIDTDEIKIKASPELVFPLAYGNIKVEKLIDAIQKEDSMFGIKPNGDIYVVFRKDSIYEIRIKDYINFKTEINVGSLQFNIGNVNTGLNLNYSVTLSDLLNTVSGEIQKLKGYDGKNQQFPAFDFKSSPPIEFKIDPIDNFDQLTFSSGKLIVKLTNRLQVFGAFFEIEIYDLTSNKTIAPLNFGYRNRYEGYDIYYSSKYFNGEKFGLPGSICIDGGSPGAATEEISVDLAGLSMSNKIAIHLKRLNTVGSLDQNPLINYSSGLDFSFRFENAQIESGKLKLPQQTTLSKTKKVENFEIADSVQIHKGVFNSGSLEFKLSQAPPFSGTAHITFPSIVKSNGSTLSFSTPFSPTNYSAFIDELNNTTIDFTENGTNPYNTLYYNYYIDIEESTNPISFNANDDFNFNIDLKNIDLYSAEGDFGQRTATIDPYSSNIFPEGFDKLNGDFTLLDPTVKLIVQNSVSAPILFTIDLVGSNNQGQTASLERDPFIIPYPKYPVEKTVTSEVLFNKENSNLINFLSLPPTKSISYSGNIKLNPDGEPPYTAMNYLETDSKVILGIEIEIPLAFTSKVIFTDTIAFDGTILKNIASGELIIKADNGIPLGIDLELSFIDLLGETVYGFPTQSIILEAANVDDKGNVTSHTVAAHSIELSESNVPDYRKANAIQMVATITSPEEGEKPARLNGSDELYLNVGLKAKLDLGN